MPKQEKTVASQALACRIRISARARRVSLRFDPRLGLELVTPRKLDPDTVHGILEQHQDWIRSQERRFGIQAIPQQEFPRRMVLPPLSRDMEIIRGRGTGPVRVLENGHHGLLLSGNTGDVSACFAALEGYVRTLARRHLVPMLRDRAARHGLDFERVRIAKQRSRWGSCSSRGTISLNAKLLFLPMEQCRYVLLHELAHTVHLNHSREFWELLLSMEPRARELDREVDRGWRYVPVWMG